MRLVDSADPEDLDGRRETLILQRSLLDFANYIQAFDGEAECGKALAVGIALAPKVEFGLVADAEEEVGGGGVGGGASHGDHAVDMLQA